MSSGRSPFFRSVVIKQHEDIEKIARYGHLTLKDLKVIPDDLEHSALPENTLLADRIIQFHGGSPYPMDHNFIGVHKNPRATLNVAIWVNRLRDSQALLRLDEIQFSSGALRDVHSVTEACHSKGMDPADPSFALEEYVHEGSISPAWDKTILSCECSIFGCFSSDGANPQRTTYSAKYYLYQKHSSIAKRKSQTISTD